MNPPPWADLLAVRLNRGRDGAQKIGDLAQAMGVLRSIIEHAIEDLRKAGRPICTGPDGVWIGESEAELLACADWLESRYINQIATVRALRRTARRYAKVRQLSLFEEVA